ncbi:hypothetical protein LGN19_08850, partial [Burkholderia sp. AU30198]|uniref:hypothetical protein n=1 Tax=Burkholderia sp. AU30198 TaxID=2879627 RepID=UPI001CF2CC94
DLHHHRQLKSQAVVPLRPLDPLLHLAPPRLGEKVSTYFRMGHGKQKGRSSERLFYRRDKTPRRYAACRLSRSISAYAL